MGSWGLLEEAGSGMGQEMCRGNRVSLSLHSFLLLPKEPGFPRATTTQSLSGSSSDGSPEGVPDLTNQGRYSLLGTTII